MSLYENVFIARQDVSSAQVDSLVETFKKIISDLGGSVPRQELWGLRTMAYKIKKNRKGQYVLMYIDAPGEAIHEMERQMHLHEDVLRFLTTRVHAFDDGPTAIMRAKERGEDRDRQDSKNSSQTPNVLPNSDSSLSPDLSNKEDKIVEDEVKEMPVVEDEVKEMPVVEDAKEVEGETK